MTAKFTTWTNMDGTTTSCTRSQLAKLRDVNSPLIKANAEELADALIDLVCSTGSIKEVYYSASFGYAMHILKKTKIFISPDGERRKYRRHKITRDIK